MTISNEYQEYLESLDWYIRRKVAIHKADYRCQVCGFYYPSLEVHHNTYVNLGHEKDEDLLVVCQSCHSNKEVAKLLSKIERMETWASHYLPGWTNMGLGKVEKLYNAFVAKKAHQRKFEPPKIHKVFV